MKNKISVIKLGGSTIANGKSKEQEGYRAAGDLIIEKFKKYKKLVCVVSAYSNTTNRLEQKARDLVANPDKRALDLLLSIGEQESAALIGIYLRSRGYKCEILTGWQAGIITNNVPGKASIQSIDESKIAGLLNFVDIVIITGFQGASSEDQITTLGRGGSDTSAIALGTALRAEHCEIITDVAGIFTTNPNEQSCAQLINSIDFSVAMEMSSSGANVIDSRAVELAKENDFSFQIIHYSSSGGGTTVSNKPMNSVCGVIDNERCVLVHASELDNKPGVFSNIIRIIGGHEIRIGFFFQSFSHEETTKCSFLLWESEYNTIAALIERLEAEFPKSQFKLDDEVAAISVIGREIMKAESVASEAAEIIEELGATILGVSSSAMRLTYVVKENFKAKAVEALHERYARSA